MSFLDDTFGQLCERINKEKHIGINIFFLVDIWIKKLMVTDQLIFQIEN